RWSAYRRWLLIAIRPRSHTLRVSGSRSSPRSSLQLPSDHSGNQHPHSRLTGRGLGLDGDGAAATFDGRTVPAPVPAVQELESRRRLASGPAECEHAVVFDQSRQPLDDGTDPARVDPAQKLMAGEGLEALALQRQ